MPGLPGVAPAAVSCSGDSSGDPGGGFMTDRAEQNVARFYGTVGWRATEGVTEDARQWEDLRPCAADYVSRCRRRVLRHIPPAGERLLDMASGPVQYTEYIEYSGNFQRRYCVDLSAEALRQARERLGEHGVYLCGSFFDLELPDDFFDCSISLHTIYHIAADRQEAAVRKLLRVTKPGQPVIIVYSNPDAVKLSPKALIPFRQRYKAWRRRRRQSKGIYFRPHPLDWWQRFQDVADIEMHPWRSLTAADQKRWFPDNRLGRWLFDRLYALEERYPDFFLRHFAYPMIVLRKRRAGRGESPA
ncbi:MAG: class I SAM-dependent methyltransferase [Gammaproteobacteria bacterium]|nr:MAG: class I SAM-dependent methyltransferase [Gammaproteobacteria bacterium]